MARGITMEDLTKGLLNYKYTGLTFEKGDKAGDLRYVLFFMYYILMCHMDHSCPLIYSFIYPLFFIYQ